MSRKKSTPTAPAQNLQSLRIGSRVRCAADGVEGRVTWANGTAVKIDWADGEKVTWKRADLAGKGLEVFDADEPPVEQAAAEPAPAELPAILEMPPVEQSTPAAAAVEPSRPPTSDEPPAEQSPVEQAGTEQAPAGQTLPVEQGATAQAAVPEPAKAKEPRTRKANASAGKEKKLSALDAAVKVLGEAGRPLSCQEMVEAMAAKDYWTSPGGKTPAATLYSAVLRELANKGAEARFVKTERGKFGLKS